MQRIETRLTQNLGDPDQRQSDQRRGVAAVDSIEQRYAEAFASKAAGAIERPVALHIDHDIFCDEMPESHRRAVDMLVLDGRQATQQHGTRVKAHRPSAAAQQLLSAAFGIAGLFQSTTVTVGNLVGSQHPGSWVSCGHGLRFRKRESQCARFRRFAGDDVLGNAGRLNDERQPEARQEDRPVGRR